MSFRGLQAKLIFLYNNYNLDSRGLHLEKPILGLEITSGIRLVLLLILLKLFQWAELCNFCRFSPCLYLIHIHEDKEKKKKIK